MANFLTTDGLQRIRNHQRDPEIQEINFSTGTFFLTVFNEFWWMPLRGYFRNYKAEVLSPQSRGYLSFHCAFPGLNVKFLVFNLANHWPNKINRSWQTVWDGGWDLSTF